MTENTFANLHFTTGPDGMPVLAVSPYLFALDCAKVAAARGVDGVVTADNLVALTDAAQRMLYALGVTAFVDEDGDPLPTFTQKMAEDDIRSRIDAASLTLKQRNSLAAAFAVDPKDLA